MSDHGRYAVPDPMIGQQVRGYTIRHKLAEGGMGAVYLARHERLENTQKVIKILLPEYARNSVLRERFEREALAVSRLRHKHIVKIDDYGQLPDGQLFFMMPFLQGRPLDAYLRAHGTLTEHRALHIVGQVCSALQHMHDAGIIHRDIKPSNIFLVEDDDNNPYHVVLIDLGIAKSRADREHVTQNGAAIGTPAYMAVEQFENAANVTPLADLYAVAIVAWEMVSGMLPWGMHSTHVLYTKQKQERPARPPGMSAEWFAILSGALSVHTYDRPQSPRALAIALASAVPAIPPHVPSGAEILLKVARTFVQHAPPSEETVRNNSDQNRPAPMPWPQRETDPSTPRSGGLPPLNVHTVSGDRPRAPTAVISGRPTPAIGPPATTLSASIGIATGRQGSPSWRLPLISIALVTAGGIVAHTLVSRGEVKDARPAAVRAAGSAVAASPPIDALSFGTPPDDAPLLAAPVLDAAAAIPQASTRVDETPRAQLKRTGAGKASGLVPAANPATKTMDRGSDSQRGSGDKFDPNAIGGDE